MLAMFAQHCLPVWFVVFGHVHCWHLWPARTFECRRHASDSVLGVGCKVFGCLGLWMIKELFDLFATKKKSPKPKASSSQRGGETR
jgi:hypothetical protein